MSPFDFGAEGVLTLRRRNRENWAFHHERFNHNSKIPLDEKTFLPEYLRNVDLVGATSRTNDSGEVDEKLAKRPLCQLEISTCNFDDGSRELKVCRAAR